MTGMESVRKGIVLVRVVLPTEEGRGPREVADPNFGPSSFKTCGSAGHLLGKSAAFTDLAGCMNVLIKRARGTPTEKRHKQNRSEAFHHADTHTHTHNTHTHTHTTHTHTTHTHTHITHTTHTHTHTHHTRKISRNFRDKRRRVSKPRCLPQTRNPNLRGRVEEP